MAHEHTYETLPDGQEICFECDKTRKPKAAHPRIMRGVRFTDPEWEQIAKATQAEGLDYSSQLIRKAVKQYLASK